MLDEDFGELAIVHDRPHCGIVRLVDIPALRFLSVADAANYRTLAPDGRLSNMKTTMDNAGRLVIPKGIRREARLVPGAPLDIQYRNGRVEIDVAPVSVRLERRGKLLVAVPRKKLPKLTPDVVERTRTQLLGDRASGE